MNNHNRTGSLQRMDHVELRKWILTYLTTPPTVAREIRRSNHILWVLGAFSKGSPSLTTFIQICTVPAGIQVLVKWVDMNPLCCWPFLSFNHWAPSMETIFVWNSVWGETEEKKGISSSWFHYVIPRKIENNRMHQLCYNNLYLYQWILKKVI